MYPLFSLIDLFTKSNYLNYLLRQFWKLAICVTNNFNAVKGEHLGTKFDMKDLIYFVYMQLSIV